jgi:hypothetical protein
LLEKQQLILGTGTAIWWLTEPHCLIQKTQMPMLESFTASISCGSLTEIDNNQKDEV